MRKWRIIGVLLLCLTLAGSIACNPFGGDEEETGQQPVEVVRGDLAVTVSGSGSIEVSKEVELAFGSGGRVDKIYVEDGDEVSKGDVLAKLETDDLELTVTQAQVALAEAQVGVTQAQVAVNQAQLSITQAEVALKNAKIALEQTEDLYIWPDIEAAQADVDEAKDYLEYCLEKLVQYLPLEKVGSYSDILEFILKEDYPKSPGYKVWQERTVHAQSRLNTAKNRLEAMLSGFDADAVAVKRQQVEEAEQSLELARQSLELNQQSLKLAQLSPELAQQSLKHSQKQLDEATITAPFDGIVASVYVDEGDVIPSPTMAPTIIIHLVDLTSMELKVEVDEIDMPGVKLGQKAIIEVDALPDFPLEGEVTSISPLAKEEAGVVVYEIKVSFDVPEGSGIRIGMSADADIIIAERSNVLLVPDRVIDEDSEGNPAVMVMVGEQTQERPVVIGLSDGFNTEIVSGLREGEVVVAGKRAK